MIQNPARNIAGILSAVVQAVSGFQCVKVLPDVTDREVRIVIEEIKEQTRRDTYKIFARKTLNFFNCKLIKTVSKQ